MLRVSQQNMSDPAQADLSPGQQGPPEAQARDMAQLHPYIRTEEGADRRNL